MICHAKRIVALWLLAVSAFVCSTFAGLESLGHASPPTSYRSGQCLDIAVENDIAYVVDAPGYVNLFNVSNPSIPVLMNSAPSKLAHMSHALTLHREHVFLAGDASGLVVIDRSGVLDGEAPYPLVVRAAFHQGTYATTVAGSLFSLPGSSIEYIATGYSYDGRVIISRLDSPTSVPVIAHHVCYHRHVSDVKISGEVLFATSFDGSPGYLDIVDLTNEAGEIMPTLLARLPVDETRFGIVGQMSIHGNILFIATSTHPSYPATIKGGLIAVDITNSASPFIIESSRQVFSDAKHMRFRNAGIACDGENLILVGGTSVAHYSVSNPAMPELKGTCAIPVDLRPTNSAGTPYAAFGGDAEIVGEKVFVSVCGDNNASGRVGGGIVAYRIVNRPVAIAGTDETVSLHALVTLDGTGSWDPEGDPITYSWSIVSQPGSAILSDPQSPRPSFRADVPGDYIIELIVTDINGTTSVPDRVIISTVNTPPIIDLGADQPLTVLYQPVRIYNGSYDPDGDDLTFSWGVTLDGNGPVEVDNPSSASPSFIPAQTGTYSITLIATDIWGGPSTGTVRYTFENVKPVAVAGTAQSGLVQSTFILDARGSSDGNGDPLTFRWSIVSAPSGSAIQIADQASEVTSCVPDLAGLYVIGLVVSDGKVDSDPCNISITAVSYEDAAISLIKEVMDALNGFGISSVSSFKNRNMPATLCNKLNTVIASIVQGDIETAREQLENDIMEKLNGCAAAGYADKNDWIITCPIQTELYPMLKEAATLLTTTAGN